MTAVSELRRYWRRLDPDQEAFLFSLEVLIPCLLGTLYWLVFRPPASILLVLSPGFIAIASHQRDDSWREKAKSMVFTAAVIALCQSGICALFQQKILLLAWMFLLTFTAFLIPNRRYESAMGLVFGSLAISMESNWLTGMNHNLEVALSLGFALATVWLLNVLTLRFRVRKALAVYAADLLHFLLTRLGEEPESSFLNGTLDDLHQNLSALALKIERLIAKHRSLRPGAQTTSERAAAAFALLQDVSRMIFLLGGIPAEQRLAALAKIPDAKAMAKDLRERLQRIASSVGGGEKLGVPGAAAAPAFPAGNGLVAEKVHFALAILLQDLARLEDLLRDKPLL